MIIQPRMDLTRLMAPRSVAVVGATDRPGSYGAQTLDNLLRAGFAGSVVGVNPRRREALGVPCVPSLDDLDGPVDAVVVATPAAGVHAHLEAAGRLGCGGAVVYAAGFGEAGRAADQDALAVLARTHGLPVLGPNANGMVSVAARAPLWGDAVRLAPAAGETALVTQSGNVGVLALAHRAGAGLHTVVSLGNAAVIDAAAVIDHLARVDGVRAVAAYLEDDGDGARLADAFAACADRDVRLVVLKAGRSAAGRAVGAAHTAALAGDHRVFAALVTEAGGVLATDTGDLLETARALTLGRRDPRALAVLTCSGGDAAIAADLAADAGVPLAPLEPATRTLLGDLLPPTATVGNPLDHTNLVWADTPAIAAITRTVAQDAGVGHVFYVLDQPTGLPPADAGEWDATRAGGVAGARAAGTEALLVATTPGQEPPGAVSGLRPALAAVAALRRPAPDPARLRAVADAARHPSGAGSGPPAGSWLAEHEAKDLLAAAGISVPARIVVPAGGGADGVVAAARRLGYPVALKVSARGLVHKSDVGAVIVDVRDADAVRTAAERLLSLLGTPDCPGPLDLPDAVLLVERMAADGVEMFVAARRDGVVPALVIGLGGLWAEVLDDVAVVPLPADAARVEAAIATLRAAPVLSGAHGRPPVDVAALCGLAAAVGDLLLARSLALVELNPVLVSHVDPPGHVGAVAVDAVVRTLDAGRGPVLP